MTSALERVRRLQKMLASLDSMSGEAADLALLLAVADAARTWASNPDALDDALAAINTQDTTP